MPRLFADTRPLHIPDFRRMFIATCITVIGGQITVVLVPAQLFAMTGSSGYAGLSGLFGLVPLIIFGLYGGALADYFDRRNLLIWSTWGLVLSSVLLAVQAFAGNTNPWVLLWIYALQQACFGISQPTRSAILPRIVPSGQLAAANTLTMTVFTFGAIGGPLAIGPLLPVVNYSWLYAIDAITLTSTLWAAHKLPSIPVETTSRPAVPGIRSVLSGLGYLRYHPILLASFIVDLIAMIFGMPRILFPEVAHSTFGGPLQGGIYLSILMVGMPVGMALGGVFSGWVSKVRNHGKAVILAIHAWGAAVILCGVAIWLAPPGLGPWLLVAVFAMALGGVADMASAAFRTTILQESASDEVRGRLQGVFIIVVAGGPRLADLVHGWGSDLIGPAETIIAGGVLVIVGTAIATAMLPAFWRYRTPDHDAEQAD